MADDRDAPTSLDDLMDEDDSDLLSGLFNSSSGGGRSSISLRGITIQQLASLLRSAREVTPSQDEEEEEGEEEIDGDEYDDADAFHYGASSGKFNWFPPCTEPQEAGAGLLNSGEFGSVKNQARKKRRSVNIAHSILNRPLHRPTKEEMMSELVPNTNGTAVASCPANIYSGQFSADSSFYYTCSQDFQLNIFDTSAGILPHAVSPNQMGYSRGLRTRLRLKNSIQGRQGSWTITDANLSPDNERMIYASITPVVYMINTLDPSSPQTPLSFSDSSSSTPRWQYYRGDDFGIWSCRFSADGTEVVAGGNGKIFVYDLLANRRTVKISAHDDDVNSCCWADTASGNVLVSASDDTFLKVWDRRSLGASPKPSGVLVGHTEGITYVAGKGDGRYILSNGKDQAMRLWDLRMMHSSESFSTFENESYGIRRYDYRYESYPRPKYKAHPRDCSVMTYRGHAVLRTLIRCNFSPAETTGGQYVYSGSADGKIHIYSLDGQIVQVLDRSQTLPMSFEPSGPEPGEPKRRQAKCCVRDVSWHSQQPVMMSAAWESGNSGSVVAQHEWKGLSKMGNSLEDWVGKAAEESLEPVRRRSTRLASRRIPGAFDDFDDEDM